MRLLYGNGRCLVGDSMGLCCGCCCCDELCSVEFDWFDFWLVFDCNVAPAMRSNENAERGDCCCCWAIDWFDIGDCCCCRIGEWVGDNGFWAFNGWLGSGGKNGYASNALLATSTPTLFLFTAPLLLAFAFPNPMADDDIRWFFAPVLLLLAAAATAALLAAIICCWKRWYSFDVLMLLLLLPGRYVVVTDDDGDIAADDESLRPFAGCHSPVAVTFVHGHWLA